MPDSKPPRPTRRPGDWTPAEKLRVLSETDGLEGEELGVVLRWREPAAAAPNETRRSRASGGRGRRHEQGARQMIIELIDAAVAAGARLEKVCEVTGPARTIACWRTDGGGEDKRGAKLTAEERETIVSYATCKEYRARHENDLMAHREPSRPRTHHRPKEHVATAPNTVWSWDIPRRGVRDPRLRARRVGVRTRGRCPAINGSCAPTTAGR